MLKKYLLFTACAVLLSVATTQAQLSTDTLLNTTTTVKNSTSELYYFGFAEGDKIIFHFEEIYGASLREFELIEYPSGTIFSHSFISEIDKKEIIAPRTGIYYFRLRQSGFLAGRRTCKLIICRIAVNEKMKKFNTNVYWEEKTDTVWFTEKEPYLIRCDTTINNLSQQTIILGKKGKNDRTVISFIIPDGTTSWAWWICTSKDAENIFEQSEILLKKQSSIVKNHGLMAHLAMGGGAAFSISPGSLNIKYGFPDGKSVQDFINGQINDSINMQLCNTKFEISSDTLKGMKTIAILNENRKKVPVTIRITSVKIEQIWGTREITKFRMESISVPYLKN